MDAWKKTGFTVRQESDNSLNKEYNNCVEMFFIHLKIFIFFSEFSQECLNITQFLDLLSGKSECLFPAPNTPHGTLPSPLRSDSHWSACAPPTPSFFSKGSGFLHFSGGLAFAPALPGSRNECFHPLYLIEGLLFFHLQGILSWWASSTCIWYLPPPVGCCRCS